MNLVTPQGIAAAKLMDAEVLVVAAELREYLTASTPALAEIFAYFPDRGDLVVREALWCLISGGGARLRADRRLEQMTEGAEAIDFEARGAAFSLWTGLDRDEFDVAWASRNSAVAEAEAVMVQRKLDVVRENRRRLEAVTSANQELRSLVNEARQATVVTPEDAAAAERRIERILELASLNPLA